MKEIKDTGFLSQIAIGRFDENRPERPDIAMLADELFAIASELRRHERQGGVAPASTTQGSTPPASTAFKGSPNKDDLAKLPNLISQNRSAYAEAARRVYASRRARASLFGNAELFGEPAWDILLDLYIANADNKPVSVSSACIGSAAPPTTGLRWLGVLADNGLVLREHDKDDQRRVLVRLTEQGVAAMDDYFAHALAIT